MIKNFSLSRSRSRQALPSWDLDLVLDLLSSDKFSSPQVSLRNLTLKTVFLLALASASRVSEIHALSRAKDDISFLEDGSVRLRVSPSFLAKNQLPEVAPSPIRVFPLTSGDRKLCPVASLRLFLQRSEGNLFRYSPLLSLVRLFQGYLREYYQLLD